VSLNGDLGRPLTREVGGSARDERGLSPNTVSLSREDVNRLRRGLARFRRVAVLGALDAPA